MSLALSMVMACAAMLAVICALLAMASLVAVGERKGWRAWSAAFQVVAFTGGACAFLTIALSIAATFGA